MKIKKKLYIVKYGSNTLVKENKDKTLSIDLLNIKNHGRILSDFSGPLIIVSSGAVAVGMAEDRLGFVEDLTIRKRLQATMGNPKLSMIWKSAIKNKRVLQGLITHKDLLKKDEKESLKQVIYGLYNCSNKHIIQFNDNDLISGEELKIMRGGFFGDNDEVTSLLAKLCSQIFEEVAVIINTSGNGVLKNGKVLEKIVAKDLTQKYIKELCGINKSSLGTGGMSNKLRIMSRLVVNIPKISVYIVNGKSPRMMEDILNNKKTGTFICGGI